MDPLSLLLSTVQAFSGAQQPAYYQPAPYAYQQPQQTARKIKLHYLVNEPVHPTNDDYLRTPEISEMCKLGDNFRAIFCGGSEPVPSTPEWRLRLVRISDQVYTIGYVENVILGQRQRQLEMTESEEQRRMSEVENALGR
ncbi:MAG: hypothetical protein QE263_04690 [Vampirovibrionales bacterium]|nr:hypothetical protein [Vampirovibrionales bacterium]